MKESPVFVRSRELTREVFKETAQFPKRVRGSLTFALELDTLFLEERLRGAVRMRAEASRWLSQADWALDRLRSKVALARDLEFLPFAGYERVSRLADEVGRLVGAWKKKIEPPGQGPPKES